MKDLIFKATDKAAWDAFAASLPAEASVDEIGVAFQHPAAKNFADSVKVCTVDK